MEAGQKLSVLEVGARWQSKKELYTILTTTGNLNLPPLSFVNQKYLRGIWTGNKLFAKCSEVKVVKVPHIKGLDVASILEFACNITDIKRYLPEYDYQKEPNRDWVWNLVNTLLHDELQEFLSNKMTSREDDLIKPQILQVRAIPEIVDILKISKAVSTSKGKSHFLLRPVIKRKSKNLIKLENQKADEDAKLPTNSEKYSKKWKQKSINLNR